MHTCTRRQWFDRSLGAGQVQRPPQPEGRRAPGRTQRTRHASAGWATQPHVLCLLSCCAHHAAVGQHHGARLQPALACAPGRASTGTGSRLSHCHPACAPPAWERHRCRCNRTTVTVTVTGTPTRVLVGGHGSSEAHARGAAASGGHAQRRNVHHGTQQLGLGHAGVAHLGRSDRGGRGWVG